jgi:hypothetical protein
MGDLDGVEVAWESVRVQYGAETHPAIRCRVAGAGWWAARGLLKAKRRADALRISEEVVGTYGSDTEADTRAHVVAVMYVRHSALRLRQVAARQRALDDLIHFVGSNPEPEVVEVIRAHKKADLLLRAAHDPD